MEEKDAVIVGARCAGGTLAIALAERGWDVLLVDRETFPSDTVSTHTFFPNTLARYERLGILGTLQASHRLSWLDWRVMGMGIEIKGRFTPIDGFDQATSVRRTTLDKAIVDTALAAGAAGSFGRKVVDLIGAGTPDSPVSGVVLDNGDEVRAKWVFGADGRGSTIAGKLGIEKERRQRGELAYLFAYWSGVPEDGYGTLRIETDRGISRWAVEDGLHLLAAAVPAEATRGSGDQRLRCYLEALKRFPDTLPSDELEAGEMISDLIVAPESLMRGFFRRPSGPGWALLGDAAHFKHPGTAQGIGDAVEQAIYIAEHLTGSDPSLDGYASWIDGRATEHYDWSFAWGRFPKPGATDKLFAGWAGDPEAAQDLRDTFSRRVEPSELMTPERLARWFADAPAPRA